MSLVVQSPLALLFCGLAEVAQFMLTCLFEPQNKATINLLLRLSRVSRALVHTTARSVIWELAHPLLLAREHLKTQTAKSPAMRAARGTLAPLLIAVRHTLQFVQEIDVKMLDAKLKVACRLDTRGGASRRGLSARNISDVKILKQHHLESTEFDEGAVRTVSLFSETRRERERASMMRNAARKLDSETIVDRVTAGPNAVANRVNRRIAAKASNDARTWSERARDLENLCEPISVCNVAPLLHLFVIHSFLCYGLRQASLTNQLEALAYSLNFHWALVQTGAE